MLSMTDGHWPAQMCMFQDGVNLSDEFDVNYRLQGRVIAFVEMCHSGLRG